MSVDRTLPSLIRNVHVIGRVEVSAHPDSLIADSYFETSLIEARPSWMPERLAGYLRHLVTRPSEPIITGLLAEDDQR